VGVWNFTYTLHKYALKGVMVWLSYAMKIYELICYEWLSLLQVNEHECFFVYEYWLWMRSRYDMHDYGGLKVVLSIRYDYGVLPMLFL